MKFNQKVGKNALLLTMGFLVVRLLAFLVFRHLAHLEGTSGIGIWGLAVELTGILVVISGFGLDTLVTREIIKDPNNRASLFYTSMKLKGITGTLGFLALVLFVNLMNYDPLTQRAVLLMASGVLFEIWAMAADSVFQARHKVERQTFSQIVSSLLYFILAWFWLNQGWGLMGIVWASLISRALRFALALAMVIPLLSFSEPEGHQQHPSLVWLFKLALPLFIASSLGILAFKIDTVLVMAILGKTDTGIYTAGRRLMDLMIVLPHLFALAVFPSLQQSRQESATNINTLQAASTKAMEWVLMVSIPLTIGCIVAAEPLIHMLVSNREFEAAAPVLRIVILGLPLISINFVANRVLLTLGQESFFVWISLAGLAVNLVLNLLLIPVLGVNGAAVTSVITLLIAWVVYYLILRKSNLDLMIYRNTTRSLISATGSWFIGVAILRLVFPSWQLGWYKIPSGNLVALFGTTVLVTTIYLLLVFMPRVSTRETENRST